MLETTHAGSLPKPEWLAEPEKLWAVWRFEGEELKRAQERAVVEWLRHQEQAGIDIVTDGEQFRIHFVHGFLEHIEGIDWEKKTVMGIRDNRYSVQVPTVTGPVSRPQSVHLDEVRFTRARTTRKLKFTLPGPMTICDTIADEYYESRSDMAMAFAEILNQEARELAAAGVDVIQFDEPAFNVFMDDQSLGYRCVRSCGRGIGLHNRRAYMLRLRHRGKFALERNLGQRLAAVRRNFSGIEHQPHRPDIPGVRRSPGTAFAHGPFEGQRCDGRRGGGDAG